MPESFQHFATDFIEAWNAHDVERVTSFYAPDYEEIDVAQTDVQRGREGIRRRLIYYLRAFPDLQVSLDACIVEDSRVVLFWTWRGTHRGTFMRIPPTGRPVAVRGTSLLTLENGHIRHGVRVWDLAGLLRSVGLLPEL
ncbi:MAG TPA: ester cyclase [Anaerolineae bacterium]|nr:ester cyclase [Anaerolineae bacterium]